MKLRFTASVLICCLTLFTGFQAIGDIRVADRLAADGLNRSIHDLLYGSPDVPARAARLVAIARLANGVVTGDPEACRALAFIYASQDKPEPELEVLTAWLGQVPDDYLLGVRWLDSKQTQFQRSSNRIAYLRKFASDETAKKPLRAYALVRLAEILHGQGLKIEAQLAYSQALKLDSNLPEALAGNLSLLDKPSRADVAMTQLAMLANNPRNVALAAELAQMLGEMGLYSQSLEMFDYAWKVNDKMGLSQAVGHDFVVQYCNACLNAGYYRRALTKFAPLALRYATSLPLKVMLVEAALAAEDQVLAEKYSGEVAIMIGGTDLRISQTAAVDLAWYHLAVRRDSDKAIEYVRKAVVADADSAANLLAMAQVMTGQAAISRVGEATVEKAAKTDPLAAWVIAEHYYRKGDSDRGSKAIHAGLKLDRQGLAGRRLCELARRWKVRLHPAEGAVEVAGLIRKFPDEVLKIALVPEESLAITISPVSAQVDPCRPVELEAQLRNTSKAIIYFGRGSMLTPALTFSVNVNGRDEPFYNIATLTFACPRALRPGELVKQKVRVDVGDLSVWLNSRPLDTIRLKISAKLAAAAPRRAVGDVLNKIIPLPVEIVRRDLLAGIDRTQYKSRQEAYTYALRLIMTDLLAKDLRTRVSGTRKVGALLAFSDLIDAGRVILPRKLAKAVDRSVLVLLCKQALTDPSDVVRAEMLALLLRVKLDDDIVGLFGAVLNDKSPIVRVRIVELLGTHVPGSQKRALERFAKDKSPIVADLAAALLRTQKPALP